MKIINFYRLRYLVQEPSFRFKGHRHGKYEANIVLDGTIELTCGSNIYQVDKEHFAIWKPGVFHTSHVISDGATLLSLEFDLDSDTFPQNESAVYELSSEDLALANIIKNSKGEALTKLTEALFIRLSEKDGHTDESRSRLSEVYRDAVNYMSYNIHLDIKVKDVAKHCGVCLTTLKKAFSEYTGKGIRCFFIEMKLHRAKELLDSGKNVFEVSDLLGFSSPAYFSQCFKSNEGISPREYKKRESK